jgi:hypothetical protein
VLESIGKHVCIFRNHSCRVPVARRRHRRPVAEPSLAVADAIPIIARSSAEGTSIPLQTSFFVMDEQIRMSSRFSYPAMYHGPRERNAVEMWRRLGMILGPGTRPLQEEPLKTSIARACIARMYRCTTLNLGRPFLQYEVPHFFISGN